MFLLNLFVSRLPHILKNPNKRKQISTSKPLKKKIHAIIKAPNIYKMLTKLSWKKSSIQGMMLYNTKSSRKQDDNPNETSRIINCIIHNKTY